MISPWIALSYNSRDKDQLQCATLSHYIYIYIYIWQRRNSVLFVIVILLSNLSLHDSMAIIWSGDMPTLQYHVAYVILVRFVFVSYR